MQLLSFFQVLHSRNPQIFADSFKTVRHVGQKYSCDVRVVLSPRLYSNESRATTNQSTRSAFTTLYKLLSNIVVTSNF